MCTETSTEPPLAQSSKVAPHTLNHITASPSFLRTSPGGTRNVIFLYASITQPRKIKIPQTTKKIKKTKLGPLSLSQLHFDKTFVISELKNKFTLSPLGKRTPTIGVRH